MRCCTGFQWRNQKVDNGASAPLDCKRLNMFWIWSVSAGGGGGGLKGLGKLIVQLAFKS